MATSTLVLYSFVVAALVAAAATPLAARRPLPLIRFALHLVAALAVVAAAGPLPHLPLPAALDDSVCDRPTRRLVCRVR
jgi:hypothetical protein